MIKILSLLTTSKEKLSYKGYFFTFILLSLSGNSFFVAQDSINKSFVIGLSCLLPLFFRKSISSNKDFSKILLYLSPYIILYVFQAVGVDDFELNSVIFIILKTWVGALIIMLLGRNFVYYYINMMTLISIISLFGFAYNIFVGILPGIPLAQIANSVVVYTQLINEWTGGIVQRNAGMFWEPGAFGGYLNIAIFFMILSKQFWTERFKTAIIIIALFTTYSTTAYVVFFLQVMVFINNNEKYKHLRIPLLLLFLSVASYYYYKLDFLQEKIEGEVGKTEMEEGRINSYLRYGDLLLDNLFIGISYTSKLNTGGNGFMWHLASVGIIGLVYYYIMVFINGVRSIGNKMILLFIVVIVLLLQGEGFLMYPLFLAFPFIKFPLIHKKIIRKV